MRQRRVSFCFSGLLALFALYSSCAWSQSGQGSSSANTVGLWANGTEYLHINSVGNVGIGTLSPVSNLDLSQGTGAIALPVGTNGTRPTGAALSNGEIRYNSSTPAVEAYVNGAWVNLLDSTSSSSVTGTGTANYDAIWTSGSAIGTGLLYESGGNVGIGTTSPNIMGVDTPVLTMDNPSGSGRGPSVEYVWQSNSQPTYDEITALRFLTGSSPSQVGAITAITDGTNIDSASLAFWTKAHGGSVTQNMTVTSSGNIGIGTTGPGGKLEVDQIYNAGAPALYLNQTVATWGTTTLFQNYRFVQTNSAATDGNYKQFNLGAGGIALGYSTTPAYGSGDAMYVNGNVGIGTTVPGATLDVYGAMKVWDTISNNHNSSSISLASSNVSFSPNGSVAMTLLAGGNVGIGTTSPATQLQVGADTTNGRIYIDGAASGTNPLSTSRPTIDNAQLLLGRLGTGEDAGGIEFMSSPAGSGYGWKIAAPDTTSLPGTVDLRFFRRNNSVLWSEAMRIQNATGNVGIGTTVPNATLDVNGVIEGRSNILASDNQSNWFGLEAEQTESPAHGSIVNEGTMRLLQFNLTSPFTATFQGTVYDSDGAIHSSSDRRLKTDIRPLAGPDALAAIEELNPVRFRWKNPQLHEYRAESGGFIAQEVQKVLPHMVKQNECKDEDCKLVGGGKEYTIGFGPEFYAYLVKAIQQLKADNDTLQAANDNLRRDFEAYKAAHP